MVDLRTLANALGGEISNGQVLAPGPGHSPQDRSLSVNLDPNAADGFVVHSFAGDDPIVCRDYVRGKAGLPEWKPDGHKEPNGSLKSGKPRKNIAATYDFTDETGTLLYQEVRYANADPKEKFRMRRPDGKGGWTWKKGEHEVPYRLPQLLSALAQGSPVAIVEGPKDADALWAIGIPATTGANGAKNTKAWRDGRLSAYFRDADVIMTPDLDNPGFRFIADVGAGLSGVAKRIRVLMLPGLTKEGADTSDWLAAGGTAEQWHELARQAPNWAPPAPSIDVVDEEAKAAAAAREKELIDEVARLSQTEYDRRRRSAASELGVRSRTLDDAREARRAALAAERAPAPLFGWWAVEPWPEKVDGDDLIKRIVARIRRHVVLRENQAIVAGFWSVLTWVHSVCVHSPILLINSVEINSGKTTLSDVLIYLVQRGLGAVSLTGAALFRTIEKYDVTFIGDEFDKLLVNNQDVRDIINAGWTRGKVVLRCYGDDLEPTPYSVFCPKMIVMKGFALPNNIRSRCLQIRLKRRKKSEPMPEWFQSRDDAELLELRRRQRRWAMDNIKSLDGVNPPLPDGFMNREGANWRLIFAVADQIGGEWPKRIREAAIEISGNKDAVEAGISERLLKDIKTLFEQRARDPDCDPRVVSSEEIVKFLHGVPGGFWLEFGKDEKPITKTKVAKMLGDHGITSSQVRVPGLDGREVNVHGYLVTLFDDAFERHLQL